LRYLIRRGDDATKRVSTGPRFASTDMPFAPKEAWQVAAV
jgi:hypothetical protein